MSKKEHINQQLKQAAITANKREIQSGFDFGFKPDNRLVIRQNRQPHHVRRLIAKLDRLQSSSK